MRLIFIFLICAIVEGCSGQHTAAVQTTPIDTFKLFDPKPDSTDEYFSAHSIEIFKNCIVLGQAEYAIKHNEDQYKIKDEKELYSFLALHKNELNSNKLYLVTDSSISFARIVSVIDIVNSLKFNSYKVINIQEYFKTDPPSAISMPTVVTGKTKIFDSTYFRITILKNGLKLNFLNKETTLKNSKELNSFIIANKPAIMTGKIILIGGNDIPAKIVLPILDVLKQNNYYRYQLLTTDRTK